MNIDFNAKFSDCPSRINLPEYIERRMKKLEQELEFWMEFKIVNNL